jgi:hypothetical protein
MKIINGFLASLFIVAGIGLMVIAYYQAQGTWAFLATAQETSGQVVDLRLGSGNSSTYHAVIRFTAPGGRTRDFVSSSGSNPPSYSVGEKVVVLYAPGHPEHARLDSFGNLWLGAVVTGGMGAAFFLASAGTFLYARLHRSQEQRLLRSGRRIEAKLVEVVKDTSVVVNGIHPFRVEAQWLDQASGQMRVFRSDRIWYNPAEFLQPSGPIPVYIDPGDATKYYVDLSFLPKLAV